MTKTCQECGTPLATARSSRRKYCSDRCRSRATKRRNRTGSQLSVQLHEARERIVALETRNAQLREQLHEARKHARRTEASVRAERGHVDKALRDRTAQLLVARDRVKVIRAELTTATATHVDRSELDEAIDRIEHMQRTLTELRDRYDQVASERDRLKTATEQVVSQRTLIAQAVEAAKRDRARLTVILGQWDVLAGRLARSAKHHRLTADDRTIVSTWSRWKKTVRSRTHKEGPKK